MTAHSPGPWVVAEPKVAVAADQRGDRLIRCEATREHIAEVFQFRDHDHKDEAAAVANARLIAAAPDLLAALKKVVAISDRDHVAWDEARAAIARAEQP